MRNGDIIDIDVDAGIIEPAVPPEELGRRLKQLTTPPLRGKTTGVPAGYRLPVDSASKGAMPKNSLDGSGRDS